VVNDDPDTPRLFSTDACLFEFSEREAAAFAELAVVADGLATDSGAQEGERADAEARSLFFARFAPAEFASGLVKPGADAALPVLVEVVAGKD
jgi:hypothetical protein